VREGQAVGPGSVAALRGEVRKVEAKRSQLQHCNHDVWEMWGVASGAVSVQRSAGR